MGLSSTKTHGKIRLYTLRTQKWSAGLLWSYGNLPLKCEIPLWPQKVSPHTDIKKVEKQVGQNLKH